MAAIPAGMDECRKPVVRVNTSTSAVEARLAQPDARTSSEMRASGAKAPRTKALHMRSSLGDACRSGHRPFVVQSRRGEPSLLAGEEIAYATGGKEIDWRNVRRRRFQRRRREA